MVRETDIKIFGPNCLTNSFKSGKESFISFDNFTKLIRKFINTLKQELDGTKAYELQPLIKERSVVNNHTYHSATEFAVSVKEGQDKLPKLYCLPKLRKKLYKARFIAFKLLYHN